ncbi:MAG: hypothetical protein ACI4QF_07375 [Kiritimatiellia bacterium]
MNKLIIMSVLASIALGGMAEEQKKQPRRMTPEIRAKLMARTGGTVVQRAQGPEFVFVIAQKRVAAADLKKVPDELEKVLNLPFALKEVELKGCPISEAPKMIDEKTSAVVIVCDDAKLPTQTLIAPEGKYALVNVAALASDSPDAEKLASRVRKQMWRSFAVMMGAANTQRYGCLLKSVHSLKDLDDLPYETVCPDPFNAVCRTATKLGMNRNRSATYRKAYIEGWAPPPQTEMQKKIVEEEEARKKAASK